MGLESGSFITDLVPTNPTGSNPRSEGDNHLRLLKTVLKNTFPQLGGVPNAIDYDPSTIDPAVDSHKIFYVTEAASGAITLPALSLVSLGFTLHFYCGEAGTISISPASGDTVTEAVVPVVLEEHDGASFVSDGTKWVVVMHYNGVRSFNGAKGDVAYTGVTSFNGETGDIIFNETSVTESLGYTPVDSAAFTGSHQTLSQNGFQDLPGGLVVQWGRVSIAAGDSASAIFTFPKAFASSVFVILATPEGAGQGGGDNDWLGVTSYSLSNCTIMKQYDGAQTVHVLALGV